MARSIRLKPARRDRLLVPSSQPRELPRTPRGPQGTLLHPVTNYEPGFTSWRLNILGESKDWELLGGPT